VAAVANQSARLPDAWATEAVIMYRLLNQDLIEKIKWRDKNLNIKFLSRHLAARRCAAAKWPAG
jgi:hypothetical protein